MENAKREIIEHIQDRKVDMISLAISQTDSTLRVKGKLEEVIPLLDFEYDDDYGTQNLYGYIWYEDGSWSNRGTHAGIRFMILFHPGFTIKELKAMDLD